MSKFDLDRIYYLLSLEEKLRGHTFMKPVHDEVMSELRQHAAGEMVPGPEKPVPEAEPTHPKEPVPDQLISEEEEEHAA